MRKPLMFRMHSALEDGLGSSVTDVEKRQLIIAMNTYATRFRRHLFAALTAPHRVLQRFRKRRRGQRRVSRGSKEGRSVSGCPPQVRHSQQVGLNPVRGDGLGIRRSMAPDVEAKGAVRTRRPLRGV